jgi:hypothetical protein
MINFGFYRFFNFAPSLVNIGAEFGIFTYWSLVGGKSLVRRLVLLNITLGYELCTATYHSVPSSRSTSRHGRPARNPGRESDPLGLSRKILNFRRS